MTDADDLSAVAVVAHILHSKLAVVATGASMLRDWEALSDGHRRKVIDLLEQSAATSLPAVQLLQYGLPAAALAELRDDARLRRGASGERRSYPMPPDEEARVAALQRYLVLDQPVQPALERVARLAAFVAGTPSAFVNLLDAERQWQAAAFGAERIEVPRGDAMCNLAVAEAASVVVEDAQADPVFSTNPFVTGRLGRVRLYAAFPLVTPSSHAIGTLCVVDEQPRVLEPDKLVLLEDLAHLAVVALEARLAGLELRRTLETAAAGG